MECLNVFSRYVKRIELKKMLLTATYIHIKSYQREPLRLQRTNDRRKFKLRFSSYCSQFRSAVESRRCFIAGKGNELLASDNDEFMECLGKYHVTF